ncbi:glycosyltransferase family 4 protein [Glaciecola sp. 1036]|uniref:glycosyltransferase family 4 protein n=1 Tax=Alteromonadaceae TaxID=72275 RepID=UPI003CFF7C55
MKTGIFVACAGRQDAGPETYEKMLVENVAKNDPNNEYHIFCFSEKAVSIFSKEYDNLIFHRLRPSMRWISLPISLPISLSLSGVSLYHSTFIPAPFSLVDSIFTMHDVSPFTHPQFYPIAIRRRLCPMIERGLAQAKHIICISEHSRQTTSEYFNIPLEKISVVYHGIENRFTKQPIETAQQVVKRVFKIDGPYLLYVGKLEARKNIATMLEAFHHYKQQTKSEHKLVLAGRRFWDLHGIDETISRLKLENDVIELGYVSDEDLISLYSAADLFLFPTLWEGFGFPVLEAMSCGLPVITSNISCLPEIANGAAELVDPYSYESISSAINTITSNKQRRDEMITLGYQRAEEFTWEATAKETIKVYDLIRNG